MRIWMYYAGVGGGHKAPAKALAMELTKKYGSTVSFTWQDYGALTGEWFQNFFEGSYAWLVHRAAWLYAALYVVAQVRPVMWFINSLAAARVYRKLARSLQQEQPAIIVATYFVLGPLVRALKTSGLRIPVVVVVTDPYSAPPIWFYYPELTYVVASETVQQTALQMGVPQKNIQVLPQVALKHEVVKQPPHTLSSAEKTVLLLGGANGFPEAEKVLRYLEKAHFTIQIVVVCGTNAALFAKATAIAKQSAKRIMVYGYVDFVPALIAASDVVIAKAGANVMHEVLSHHKPLIISHYIWGQEKGNKDFVVDHGLGFYEPNAKKIPALVQECLYDEAAQQRLMAAHKKIRVENGTAQAVQLLSSLVK